MPLVADTIGVPLDMKGAASWATSSVPITKGCSWVCTFGTSDGAHRTSWDHAVDPCMPAWPSPASTRVPCGAHAADTSAQPRAHDAARGARS